jgi:N-acetylglucosamine malate deacetylase 1
MSTEPRSVLVVSAHPDDETFGCGGTLMRLRSEGHQLHWIVATESWQPKWTKEYHAEASAQVDAVAAEVGFTSVHRLALPAARLDDVPLVDVLDPIIKIIADVRPAEVMTVGPHDVNSDHQVVFRAVTVALKPSYAGSVRRVISYEIPGSTDWALAAGSRSFTPTVFIDISDFIEKKVRLAELYRSELREPPHPRSVDGIRALARTRGLSVGTNYAEAFELHRELVR